MLNLDLFAFNYSDDLIALNPLENRDQANMLVFKNKSFLHKKVHNLLNFISKKDLLVFNNTSVIPCRLVGRRFRKLLSNNGSKVSVTLNKQINDDLWSTFCNPLKKLKEGDIITFSKDLTAEVIAFEYEQCLMSFKYRGENFIDCLKKIGKMPIPPYIIKKREHQNADFKNYQTPFARIDGSVAAPTASLHFSDELVKRIKRENIPPCYITLHVSGGTFLPIRENNIDDHKMHSEYAKVDQNSADLIKNTIKMGGKVIAIGTTVMRVLESSCFVNNDLNAFEGSIDTFIKPGHDFKVCSGLFTNFHQPKSTLFVLVNAFIGIETASYLYSLALERKYRLFSYGDCCLLLP